VKEYDADVAIKDAEALIALDAVNA